MKKVTFLKSLLVVAILALVTPPQSFATPVESTISAADEARATQLKNRLEEIRAMDTRSLSKAEKKALRVEVRKTKKELAAISGGVYLSIGAILLIALLIILLA